MDVHDWWRRTRKPDGRLKLSSRRLLVVLENLDEDSPFKNAYREDWSEDKYIRVNTLNELRLQRVDNAAMHAQHTMDLMLVKSPAQRLADLENESYIASVRGGILAQLKQGK